MRYILYFVYGIVGVLIIYELLTRKYKQPYQLNMVIGRPGSGKSTMYAKLAHRYLSRGYHVYGTDPITVFIKNKKTRKKTSVQVKEIKVDQLYRYQFPENSVILVDEGGTIFHNRNYKNFDKRNVLFFKRYRHDKLIIWFWSQSFDIDLVIRNLVSQFWICERYLRCWSVCRRLIMKPVVVHPSEDAPARISDDFVEDPKLLKPILGGMMVTFIPHWIKMFDSFELPENQLALRDIDLSDDPVPYEPLKKNRWYLKDLKSQVKECWSKLRGRHADAKRRVILLMRSLNVTTSMGKIKHRLGMTRRHLANRLPKGRSDKKSQDDELSRTIYHAE